MKKVILKAVAGVLVGLILYNLAYMHQGGYASACLICIAWGMGIVYGFRSYLRWLSSALNASLRLGLLAALAFGSGLIGFLLLLVVLFFVLICGWLYGWYLLIRDIIALL